MNVRRAPTRRGVALLVVLASLVLAMSAAGILVRVASTAKVRRTVARQTAIADELLQALDAPIRAWLASKSGSIVLPPDVSTPEIGVLHDTWMAESMKVELEITGWDQCGMVPLRVGRSASPLRLAVPTEILDVLDRMKPDSLEAPGLDVLGHLVRPTDEVDVFPAVAAMQPVVFGEPAGGAAEESGASPGSPTPRRIAIGAFVSTHNTDRINVNTAPLDLVDEALRAAGRGGLEQIEAARDEGRRFELGAAPPPSSPPGQGAPEIVDSSSAWAFRIDLSVGAEHGLSIHRSWWAVYTRNKSAWELTQRLAILK